MEGEWSPPVPTRQGACGCGWQSSEAGLLKPFGAQKLTSEFKMADTAGIHTSDLGLSFGLFVTAPWFFLPEGRKYTYLAFGLTGSHNCVFVF